MTTYVDNHIWEDCTFVRDGQMLDSGVNNGHDYMERAEEISGVVGDSILVRLTGSDCGEISVGYPVGPFGN